MVNHIERELAFRERQWRIDVHRDYFTEQSRRTRDIAADYGKWMIASLLLVNGGAIIALLRASLLKLIQVKVAGIAFTSRIALSILCGLATWINWYLLNSFYEKYARPAVILGTVSWPIEGRTRTWITATFW